MAEMRRGCYPWAHEGGAMNGSQLRVGVAGAGYFGRFHALKLAGGARTVLSGVHDALPDRAAALAAETGSRALGWDALLAASDAVVIASPAATHHAAAAAALRAGLHVLVEKPIATNLAEADALIALARDRGRVLQIGHLLRYSPERAAIVARMAHPAYIECTRIAPYKPRGTDVSVVLDLMVHDLDMVLSLIAAKLESVDAIGAAVVGPYFDMANARLRFANGAVAMLVASRVASRTERRMRLFGREGMLTLDFADQALRHVRRPAAGAAPDPVAEQVRWPALDLIAVEHAAFAAAILDSAPVLVDGAAGRRALEAALMVEAAAAANLARAAASGLL